MSGVKMQAEKSTNPYEINRRAKRKGITIEELQETEAETIRNIQEGKFFCRDCETWKEAEEDRPKNGWYCKECYSRRSRGNYDRLKQKSSRLLRVYGISMEEYNLMKEKQNGKCAICHIDEKELDRELAVDHCHTTGVVRGLLCSKCNLLLGQIQDNKETVKRMLAYLDI
jgi:hypothetical protein